MVRGWVRRSRAFGRTSGVVGKARAFLLARHQSGASPRVEPEQNRQKLPMRKALCARMSHGSINVRAARAWVRARFQVTLVALDQRPGRANRPAQAGVEHSCP